MTPVEIAYIVVAVAIVALVVCMGIFLCKASRVMDRVSDMLENSNAKMECLDPLFMAIANVGEGLEHKSALFKEHSICQCESCSQKKSPLEQYLKLALVAARLWKNK
ncbi:MAG: hypothetical protein JSR37_02555 [Verrucomicrobia bacterium]|nr:hypothetical protein [Verrucomicrobiota bacterium]MBS0637440.1 hypothetical protein [Verrucomicrobiota bacterium]